MSVLLLEAFVLAAQRAPRYSVGRVCSNKAIASDSEYSHRQTNTPWPLPHPEEDDHTHNIQIFQIEYNRQNLIGVNTVNWL
jgi:hypothetical protein